MIEKILPIILVAFVLLFALSITSDMMTARDSLVEICENKYGTIYLVKESFEFSPNGCLYIDEMGESHKVFFDYIENKWIKRAED
jgi:hypothetical protein